MKSWKTKFSSESDIIDLYEKTLLKFQNNNTFHSNQNFRNNNSQSFTTNRSIEQKIKEAKKNEI